MSYKYKAKNGLDFIVPGVGQSKDGILETDVDLSEAPALELVSDQAQPVQAVQTAAPNAVIGVAPQATQAPQQTQASQGASN